MITTTHSAHRYGGLAAVTLAALSLLVLPSAALAEPGARRGARRSRASPHSPGPSSIPASPPPT